MPTDHSLRLVVDDAAEINGLQTPIAAGHVGVENRRGEGRPSGSIVGADINDEIVRETGGGFAQSESQYPARRETGAIDGGRDQIGAGITSKSHGYVIPAAGSTEPKTLPLPK